MHRRFQELLLYKHSFNLAKHSFYVPPTHCQVEAENYKEGHLLLEVAFLIETRKETAKKGNIPSKGVTTWPFSQGPSSSHSSSQRSTGKQGLFLMDSHQNKVKVS